MSALEIMAEDRSVEDVLDKFVSCHEQTYEEFLSTFTHLSKEDNVIQRRVTGSDYSESLFTTRKSAHDNESEDHHLRNKTIFLHTSSQCSEEEQIVLDESQKVGGSLHGDTNQTGKRMVDNFLGLEDLDVDEEIKPQMSQADLLLLLPGEVEQDFCASVPSFIPSVNRPLAPEVKPGPPMRGAPVQMEEILGDEVQPFSLDEEFDYDSVVLTPKFTPAEMRAIQEQKRKDASTDVEAPQDPLTETS
ncbi:intraflagellar transport-associated protein [Sorex araneus]|uniref:intraflagellar transport-associated protein n=1 Tax=Sorex araneus TaxID=42254 RepID=UPI0024334EB4|nr:intraflagellar transport-associated protein [Sorex araneus]XP_054999092.1 intraflagellar transport-associated protein [Sorex araneus]XP_054999093.1 intraflagellar transport-associated protein [Sorex araneus]